MRRTPRTWSFMMVMKSAAARAAWAPIESHEVGWHDGLVEAIAGPAREG